MYIPETEHRRQSRRLLVIALAVSAVMIAGCSSAATAVPPTAAPPTAAPATAAAGPASAAPVTTPAPAASVAAKQESLGFILSQNIVSRWNFDTKGFSDEAAKLGDTVTIVQSNNSAATQESQVEDMITKKVGALVITPVDVSTAGGLFAEAKAAGIPTVDYNFTVPNMAPAYIVERNSRDFGRGEAQLAVAQFPTGNYVIVGGDPAQSVALDETAGYMDVLQPLIAAGKIKIVSKKMNTGWVPAAAEAQVESALVATGNKIQAVLSNNDGMALAAMQALKNAGLLGKVFVSGVDCDLPNVQDIAQGYESVCAWNDFYKMGEYGAQAADAAARGITFASPDLSNLPNGTVTVPTIDMPTILVQKSNLCSWLKQYQWVPFDQAYKFVSPVPSC